MKAIQKACLTGIVFAGLLSANIAPAYDGDVDYSAPYVTLDPETGKLITVDPKQQQAAAQAAPQHEGSTTDTAATATAAPAMNAGPDAGETPASAGTNPVFIAVAAIVLVAVVVAATRRKAAPGPEDRTS